MFAADFRDRVAHHLLVAYQERVFEALFIHDSYACRKGKGTLAASDRLMAFLRQVTANGQRPAWALKLDVASFFPSIYKVTLYEILARRINDPKVRWLTQTLLFHDPSTHYHFQSRNRRIPGPESPHYPVPPAKGLFGKHNERGLPRRHTLENVRARLTAFERAAVRPRLGGTAQRIDLRRQDKAGSVERLHSVLASYKQTPAAWRGVAGLGGAMGTVSLACGAVRAPGLDTAHTLAAAPHRSSALFPVPVWVFGASCRQ